MGFPHIRDNRAKIETVQVKKPGNFSRMSVTYSINPTKSELIRLLDMWGHTLSEADYSELLKYRFNNRPVSFIRGLAVEDGDLYAWDPMDFNHGLFALYFGLDGWAPLFLLEKGVIISPYEFYEDAWPKECKRDFDNLVRFVENFKGLKNIYGKSFPVEAYPLF